MKQDITFLFAWLDDFCIFFDESLQKQLSLNNYKLRAPTRKINMSMSEILTILIMYQQSPCKNFKYFYNSYLQLYKTEFPCLVSYERFVVLKSRALPYLSALMSLLMKSCTQRQISFIDSTSLNLCHSKRISRNKVFKGIATIGKSSKGWFYGFKLHLQCNDLGEIMSIQITRGNVDDRVPVPSMLKGFEGSVFADKGYISAKLFKELYSKGIKLVTGIKGKMKNHLMPIFDKIMLRKRSIVETLFDYLKNKFEIEHSRHRSVENCLVHILSTLIAYSLKSTKPKVKYQNAIPQT